jgi:DNA polymerase
VLGATAAKALLGPSFRVTRSRGVLLPWPESAQRPQDFATAPAEAGGADERRPVTPARLLATIHPSAVLRADDRDAALAGLVADLTVAAKELTA